MILKLGHCGSRRLTGGGRGVAQVGDLEDHAHRGGERDALVGDQREHLVVVHDGVHALDPLGVDVAVEDDELGHGARVLRKGTHDERDDAVVRVLGHGVHVAVEVVGGARLRVEARHERAAAALLELRLRVDERLPQLRLGRAWFGAGLRLG